jgi:uncharacterized protein (TIRG00374 family)
VSNFWKHARRWLPGAIISIILVVAILYLVDLRATLAALRTANYRLLLVAIAGSVIWLIVRSLVWRTLLQDRAPYRDVFLTINEGYLLNNFLPFRLGELGRAFLLSRKSEMGFVEILPTIVIERVSDLAFSAAILALAVPFVIEASGAIQIAFVVGGIVLVGLAALYLLARNRAWALDVFHRLSAHWPAVQHLGGHLLDSFFAGLAALNNGWLFLRFLFWMTLDWLIAILNYYLIILAFFPQANLIWGMFGLGAAAFGGAIPSLPGAVGTFEGAFGGALTFLSNNEATALAVALTARLYNYLVSGIFGVYALANEGQTLSGIYQQLVKLRSKQETTRIEPN